MSVRSVTAYDNMYNPVGQTATGALRGYICGFGALQGVDQDGILPGAIGTTYIGSPAVLGSTHL